MEFVKQPRVMVPLAFVLVFAVGLAGWFGYHRNTKDSKKSETSTSQSTEAVKPEPKKINEQGGTFTFTDGIIVVVPKGAVDVETEIVVSAPLPLKQNDAGPLTGKRASGVLFDVSLVRGETKDIQPRVPLTVKVPLNGSKYAPPAPKGGHILSYTANPAGGFLLLPATVNSQYLSVEMSHLSRKYVVYITDAELLRSFDSEKTRSAPANCAQEATINGQKVKFGSKSRGWSLKDNSPIYACIYAGSKSNEVRVGIVNRIDYILPVAATKDFRLAATSDKNAETEAIKSLARNIFNIKQVRAYIAENEEAVGSVMVDDLPATIELQGDPHTFLAEAVWQLLNVAAMVFVGESSTKTVKLVKNLIESVDVIGCLQDKLHDTDKPDWFRAVRAVTDCTGPILDVISRYVPGLNILKRAQAAWDLGIALGGSTVRAINGIKLQFINTLRVEVVAVTPELDSRYVGKWWVHGSTLNINKNGTGTNTWNAGPCSNPVIEYEMCLGNAALKFKPGPNGQLIGTYTKVWYTGDRNRVVNDEEYDLSDELTGTSFVVKQVERDVLITSGASDPDDPNGPGNPYLCRIGSSDPQGRCGA